MIPKVSLIIVSYNTCSQTVACLSSIYRHTRAVSFEVIVVDNASTDDSVKKIKKLFPWVILVQSKANLGFGSANNLGVKKARGEYVFLLNPDTLFFQNSLKILSDWLDSHPGVDLVCPRLLNRDHSLQYSLGSFPSLSRVIFWMWFIDDIPLVKRFYTSFHLEHPRWYQKEHEIDWGTGAAIMVKKNTFEKTNGFDLQVFMYAEETEWQMRLKKTGAKSYYSMATSIVHLGRSSTAQISSYFTIASELKGIIYIFQKHFPPWQSWLVKPIIKIGIILRMLVFFKSRRLYEQVLHQI